MILRSALIGANTRRAAGHAASYSHTDRAKLVAVSARTPGVSAAFADRWRVPQHFRDHVRMLADVRPDIVHINVPPDARRELLRDCEEAGVAGIVLEKPIGLDVDDLLWLEDFSARTAMRIAVNHQLHFHDSRRRVAELVADGSIGTVRTIEGSARHLLGYQGTHVLEGILDLARAPVGWVTASASGVKGFADPGGHASPDSIVATLGLGDAVGIFRCGVTVAPEVTDERAIEQHHHKRLLVTGDAGLVEWTMWGIRLIADGAKIAAHHDYYREDALAQARLVDALCDWILGGNEVATSLRASLDQFRIVLAMYRSVVEHRAVSPAAAPREALLPALAKLLTSRSPA